MLRDAADYIAEFQDNFRIADALDIAIITVLLYGALVWFKQTASRGIVVGAILITALYFLARSFDLYLTSLVFHTGFAVLLVLLVVLFQEELRRAFERIAGWGTLSQLRPKTTVLVEEIDAIVETAFTLADQRIGALIVLSGCEPLTRHIDGGIALSGQITKPILFSIFDPSSAGHDGAVIIERDRIEKFGAHLPISKNHKEIRGRGTRHSAALGLAECSDALTIVVSEERGVVSIAESGKLFEMPTASDLKERVEHFLEERFPQKRETTWKRLVRHDGRWKLLALLLAIASWYTLAFDVEKVQTSVVIPIQYRNLPENAQLDESTPVEAVVTLTGFDRDFQLLDRNVLRIVLDLSDLKGGADNMPIRDQDVRLPPNLRVDRIQPSTIKVRLQYSSADGQEPRNSK